MSSVGRLLPRYFPTNYGPRRKLEKVAGEKSPAEPGQKALVSPAQRSFRKAPFKIPEENLNA